MKNRLLLILIALFWASIPTQSQEDCTDALEPRLVLGHEGMVLPGPANNVRDTASRSGALLGEIPGGELFEVLDGPVCSDSIWWWQVEFDDMVGWTVEGKSDSYWLEPVAAPLPLTTDITFQFHNGRKIYETEGTILDLVWSPDGDYLAAGIAFASLKLFDVNASYEIVWERNFNADATDSDDYTYIRDMDWSPDGTVLVVAFTGIGQIILLDMPSGEVIRTIDWPASRVLFSPDGQTLLTSSGDTVRVWDVETGALLKSIRQLSEDMNMRGSNYITDLAIAPNGQSIAYIHRVGQVYMWNLEANVPMLSPPKFDNQNMGQDHFVTYSNDGEYLIYHSGQANAGIMVWEIATGEWHKLYIGDSDRSFSLKETIPFPGTNLIAYVSEGTIHIVDFITHTEHARIAVSGYKLAFSSDGQWLATAGGGITVWQQAE